LNDENVDESEANELHARINELESELETARLQVQQSKEIDEINKSRKEVIFNFIHFVLFVLIMVCV
jgi:outer membrane murein-binding lipoprotein Lpp